MMDTPILPLLSPKATQSMTSSSGRRQRILRFNAIFRYLGRRRPKFYFIAFAFLFILAMTILHKIIISMDDTYDADPDIPHDVGKSAKKNFETRTMKTIIGRYVGPKPAWADSSNINISDKVLNTNNYDPDPEIGQNGQPAYLPGYPEDQLKILYSINRFNLAASDKISVDRKLPDARKLACRKKKYQIDKLPNTSVIIVFHNEAWSTLVRTIHSILNTSPQHLLAEILLIDDASKRDFLGKSLEYYMNNLSSVRGVNIKMIRSQERIGLIRARLLGVDQAKGEVLTFIDAHCEATNGWLEPLLEQIKLDRTSAACPIIDIINEENFAFTRSFELHMGAFNWGLNFRWYPISKRELVNSNGFGDKRDGRVRAAELTNPFQSPIMAGGLFSIDRKYFVKIGKYDPHMDIWGGENIELSLRLWQCGGKVKIVPCSHVAHIFRKSSPYDFRPGKEVGDILYTNLARVAEVWMDEWRDFFYSMNPIVNKTLNKVTRQEAFIDIEARKQLRNELDCKNFTWFLDNIWPEHFFPKNDRFFGRLRFEKSNKCLTRPTVRIGMGQASVGAVQTSECGQGLVSNQLFVYDRERQFIMTDENICLDSGSDPMPSRQVILAPCSESKRQKWSQTGPAWGLHQIRHIQSDLCLESTNSAKVQLENCHSNLTDPSTRQTWTFLEEKWHN